jgi:hypothetical protein
MADRTDLYEQDFFAWTQEQAARLRRAGETGLNAIGAKPLEQAQVLGDWLPEPPTSK